MKFFTLYFSALSKIFIQEKNYTVWTHMPSYYESGSGTTCNQIDVYPRQVFGTVGQVRVARSSRPNRFEERMRKVLYEQYMAEACNMT